MLFRSTSVSQHSTYVMEAALMQPLQSAILSGNLSSSVLSGILQNAADAGKQLAISMAIGVGFNLAGSLASAAVSVPKIANELKNDNLRISQAATIIPSAVDSVNRYIQSQSILVQKAILARVASSNKPVLPGSCLI